MTASYPLAWPPGRKRGLQGGRLLAKFKTERNGGMRSLTVADARERLQRELDRIGARGVALSSNVELRLDGLPRSGQSEPPDRGVALYFTLAGKPHCLPCDTYTTVADNVAAIAAHIEATRAIERHGVASIAEMFTGFQALPPPAAREPWHIVLGVPATASTADIEAAYRAKAKTTHPDAGGDRAGWDRLNIAIDQAREARRG